VSLGEEGFGALDELAALLGAGRRCLTSRDECGLAPPRPAGRSDRNEDLTRALSGVRIKRGYAALSGMS